MFHEEVRPEYIISLAAEQGKGALIFAIIRAKCGSVVSKKVITLAANVRILAARNCNPNFAINYMLKET